MELALRNISESINRHADLCKAQIQVEAQRAYLHIQNMIHGYHMEDVFKRRSEGQRRRWADFHRFNKVL